MCLLSNLTSASAINLIFYLLFLQEAKSTATWPPKQQVWSGMKPSSSPPQQQQQQQQQLQQYAAASSSSGWGGPMLSPHHPSLGPAGGGGGVAASGDLHKPLTTQWSDPLVPRQLSVWEPGQCVCVRKGVSEVWGI